MPLRTIIKSVINNTECTPRFNCNVRRSSVVKKIFAKLKGEEPGQGGMKDVINSPGMKKIMKKFGYKEEDFEGINEVLGMMPGN